MLGRYEFDVTETPIGKGANGFVMRSWVSGNNDQFFAIKVPNRDDQRCTQSIEMEYELLRNLSHERIVQVHELLHDDTSRPCLVMEFIQGGELLGRIVQRKRYTERNARDVIRALLEAIEYLHSNNIVHRDLKPENILLTGTESDTDFKIVDFGIAKVLDNTNMTNSFDGTHYYKAPEVQNRQPNGKENDMWAIGMITFILLWGKFPFHRKTQYWAEGFTFALPASEEVSADARDFVRKLLDTNPHTRMNVSSALQHPWIVAQRDVLDQLPLEQGLQELIRTQTSLRHVLQKTLRTIRIAVQLKLGISPSQNTANAVVATTESAPLTRERTEEGNVDKNAKKRRKK